MTTTTELCEIGSELIKTDCIGRIRVSAQHREQLLDSFETSGMSGQKFAEHCGVKYQTFVTWVQKRKRARNGYPEQHDAPSANLLQSIAEVELTTGEVTNGSSLNIELPGGAKLVLDHPGQAPLAAALINKLSR